VEALVFDKPYEFVPPYEGRFWPATLQKLVRWYLRWSYGITEIECHGLDRLRQAHAAGQSILLAPNHCRPCDPFVVSELTRRAGTLPYMIGSWHLFMQGRFQAWILRRAGVFSIYREGVDRAAINAGIEILSAAKHPLVLFPEGVVSRANDRLNPLMEGVALIARSAAKRRAAQSSATQTPAGQVVVLPVALRYLFQGDLAAAVSPVLTRIEQRLSWREQRELPLPERIKKLGEALLGLKETEYLGSSQPGPLFDRLQRLTDHLLAPIEAEYLRGAPEPGVVQRVKKLRAAILPDMIQGELPEAERQRRWRQLADLYLAQQLAFYPVNYLGSGSNPDHILETVERLEEDLTDVCHIHPPMKVIATIGEPIVVSPVRERGAEHDPLMTNLETQLGDMLGIDHET
jgi:1-acyl-sn-glycerol-3-phosphate acyltransferase